MLTVRWYCVFEVLLTDKFMTGITFELWIGLSVVEKLFVECEKYIGYTIWCVDRFIYGWDYNVVFVWCGAWWETFVDSEKYMWQTIECVDRFIYGRDYTMVMNWFERGKTFDECEKYIGDTI